MKSWPSKQLRFLFSVSSGATPASGNPDFWNGKINWATPSDVAKSAKTLTETRRRITEAGFESCGAGLAPPGTIILTRRAPIGQLAISEQELSCSQGCFLLEPSSDADSEFYFFWLSTQKNYLQALGRGTTFVELSTDTLRSLQVPCIPLAKQKAISDYLNRETADIDGLISAKQHLLNFQAEKRSAIVDEAVMRGINPAAPLRPSGIEWLGDIPAHWEVERSRWLFTVRDNRSDAGEGKLLTVSRLTGVTLQSARDAHTFSTESTVGYKLCSAGDLVINPLLAWKGAMGTAPISGIVNPTYNVYIPRPSILPGFADKLVRTQVFAKEVARYSKEVWSSRLRFCPEGFFKIYWPVPPRAEQREIVEFIESETTEIDRLSEATENSVALLTERRVALISETITGQTDIKEAA